MGGLLLVTSLTFKSAKKNQILWQMTKKIPTQYGTYTKMLPG